MIRKYTPTSSINEKGFFDVPIKIYYKETNLNYPDGGAFTQYIDTLRIGDTIEIAGPAGRTTYCGEGVFKTMIGEEVIQRKKKNIGMIAGGTGITPCFQLIQYCITQSEDLNISLLYANKTENDILLKPILEEFVAEQMIYAYFVLEKPPEDWKMGSGFITAEHIQERMPPPDKDTLIFHCGPKPMNLLVKTLLTQLGYTDDMIVKF